MYILVRIMAMILAVNGLGLVAMLNVQDVWVFPTGAFTALCSALIMLNFAHHKGLQD